MARISEYEVKQIVSTSLTEEQVAPFVTLATGMVDDICLNVGYGYDTLRNIELALSAWLVSRRDARVTRQKIDDAEVWFESSKSAAGKYWEMVQLADYKGLLAQAMRKRGRIYVEALV